jgi:hypothetical protein
MICTSYFEWILLPICYGCSVHFTYCTPLFRREFRRKRFFYQNFISSLFRFCIEEFFIQIYFFCVSKLSIDLFFKLPVNSYLAINIEGKIGQPTVIRTSSFNIHSEKKKPSWHERYKEWIIWPCGFQQEMSVQDDEIYKFFMFYSNNLIFIFCEKKLSREKISHQNVHPKVKWSDLYSLLL